MSGFPRSPALVKGALVAYDTARLGSMPNAIVFQYNPEELSRSFAERTRASAPGHGESAPEEAPAVSGPPVESLQLKVEIDATDMLERQDLTAVRFGIHPALAALELLLTPTLRQMEAQKALGKGGSAAVGPAQLPLVLFVWGASRVLPVKVISLAIRETAFDAQLNPIHAEVTLGLQVLTYQDLAESSLGYQVYLATQARREVLARLGTAASAMRFAGLPLG